MKKQWIGMCALLLCAALVTACGQRPEMPESSIPLADVSDTTTTTEETTTTTEETTTTTTTAETTTTTAKPTTTTKKPTTTTTTTTTTTATTTTTTTTKPTVPTHCSTRDRIATTTSMPAVEEQELPSFGYNGYLYDLDIDEFQYFLQEPSMGRISLGTRENLFADSHFIFGGLYMPMTSEFRSMVTSETVLSQYLAEQGIHETVLGAVPFAGTFTPITIWVKTEQQNLFITVDWDVVYTDDVRKDVYNFDLFTEEEYVQSKILRTGALYVDEMQKETELPISLNEDLALMPLTDVLVACGAIVTDETEECREFFYNGQKYVLNFDRGPYGNQFLIKHSQDAAETNFLFPPGGRGYYVFFENGDIMVDDGCLYHILRWIHGKNVPVTLGEDRVTIQLNT